MVPSSGQDPLLGPLSQLQGDDVDGPEPDPEVDEQRFQPRSDDEDTCVAPADTTKHTLSSTSLSPGRRKHTFNSAFSETLRTSLITIG